MEQQEYAQRGYLREDFRLFHLKGAMEEQLDWHYHTFHKLIFFLGGQSGYGVEGRSYPLEPGDVILVPQGCVHLSPDYLARAGTAECPLDSCFTLATARFRFVLRPQEGRQALRRTLFALESASVQPGFGQELLAKSLLTQLLILLHRAMDAQPQAVESLASDEKIAAIMQYLSQHPTESVSIDDLAARFYISKYHMMRRFRAETGYTVHAYLTGKRLALAREQIAAGTPILQAASACGFGDYSAFCRAYRRQFGQPPSSAKQDAAETPKSRKKA